MQIPIGCTGGGSNFSGLVNPFLGKNFREGKKKNRSINGQLTVNQRSIHGQLTVN